MKTKVTVHSERQIYLLCPCILVCGWHTFQARKGCRSRVSLVVARGIDVARG